MEYSITFYKTCLELLAPLSNHTINLQNCNGVELHRISRAYVCEKFIVGILSLGVSIAMHEKQIKCNQIGLCLFLEKLFTTILPLGGTTFYDFFVKKYTR